MGKGIDQSTRYFDIRGKRGHPKPSKSEGLAKKISSLYPGMPPRDIAAFTKENPVLSNSALLPKLSAFVRHRHLPWYTSSDLPPARLRHPPRPSQPTLAPKERALAAAAHTSLAPVVLRVPQLKTKTKGAKGKKADPSASAETGKGKKGRKGKAWKKQEVEPRPMGLNKPKPSHLRADPRMSVVTEHERTEREWVGKADAGEEMVLETGKDKHEEVV